MRSGTARPGPTSKPPATRFPGHDTSSSPHDRHGGPADGARYIVVPPTTGMADRLTAVVTNYAIVVATDTTVVVDWQGFSTYYHFLLSYYHFRDDFGLTRSPPLTNETATTAAVTAAVGMPRSTRDSVKNVGKLAATLLANPVTRAGGGHGGIGCLYNGGCGAALAAAVAGHSHDDGEMLTGYLPFKDAYRVLFEHLFEPTPLLQEALVGVTPELYAALVNTSLAAPPVTKVMLQIRVGDLAIKHFNLREPGNELKLEEEAKAQRAAQSLFECWRLCALSHIPGAPGPLIWLVMTDSEHIKAYASGLARRGEQAFVNTLSSAVTVQQYGDQRAAGAPDPVLYVIAEQWLGTFCSMHVVTGHSGLGRQAAFRSATTTNATVYCGRQFTMRENNWETMFNDEDLLGMYGNSTDRPKSCTLCEAVPFREAANHLSKI